jgi:hypothetical protein
MSKILISGTGRCGTTFLIKLFTFLNFNTGFTKETYMNFISTNCNSGMEKSYNDNCYILKNPTFVDKVEKIIERGITIKYMIIPIRNFYDSAASREKHKNLAGGLWNARDKNEQVEFYNKIMANYLCYMVKYDINTIFIDFDKMITNKKYLFEKLKVILDEKKIDYYTFIKVYDEVSLTSRPQ